MAVGLTEFLIGHPIRSVVDVGCGEAPWFPVLRRMRPDVRYVGIDSSAYAVERYGKSRNIRHGTFDDLGKLRLPRSVDLVVCAMCFQYVDDRGVERGLKAIRRILGGVAYIEAFTTEDDMDGDPPVGTSGPPTNTANSFQARDFRSVARTATPTSTIWIISLRSSTSVALRRIL